MSRRLLDPLAFEHSQSLRPQKSLAPTAQQWLYSSKSHRQIVEEDPYLQPAKLALAKEKREETGSGRDVDSPKWFHAHRQPELAEHGVGIHLYFQLIAELAVMFFALFLIKLPQTIFTYRGSMLKLGYLYSSLLGNIGTPDNYDGHDPRVAAELMRTRSMFDSDSDISIQRVIFWFGVLDFVCSLLVFAFGIYFIRYRVGSICTLNDKVRHTMSEYSIMVTRLPPKLDPAFHRKYQRLLRHHFLDILEDCPLPPNDPYCPRWSRIKEIVIVRVDQNGIETLMELGKLKHEMALMEARARCGGAVRQSHLDKTLAKIDNIVARLKSSTDLDTKDKPVSTAFVTFQHASDKDYLVKSYAGSRNWLLEKSQAPSLRFHGHPLKVKTAPEPEDIIWESLNVPYRKRIKSTLLIWAIVAICLMCSFILSSLLMGLGGYVEPYRSNAVSAGYGLRSQIASKTETWTICDFRVYSDYTCTSELKGYSYRPLSVNGEYSMEKTTDKRNLDCSGDIYTSRKDFDDVGLDIWFNAPTKVGCVSFKQGLYDQNGDPITDGGGMATKSTASLEACDKLPDSADLTVSYPLCTRIRTGQIKESQDWPLMTWNQKTTNLCADVSVGSWDGLGEHLTSSTVENLNNREWYMNCYCTDSMSLKRVTDCREFYRQYFILNASMYSMLLSIAIINTGLQYLIQYLVWNWEHPTSNSQRMTMSFSKIFIAQYLNSGFNVLLTGGAIFPHEIHVGDKTITGLYGDMSGGWYETTGARLMSYGYFFIFFPQLFSFIFPVLYKCYRGLMRSKQPIQYDLDLLYAKPEFALDCKLAAVIAIACFMLTYAGPMPLMPLCGCIAMFTLYWSDKFEFIYESRQPPKYNEQIITVAVALLQVGLLVRTGISMAAFGHPLVAPSCALRHGSDRFLDMIITAAEEEQVLLTYEYIPPGSAALAPKWAWARFKSYLLSCGSFPSTVYAIMLIFLLLNLALYSVFFACRVSESGVVTKTMVRFYDTLTDHFVPRETLDEFRESNPGTVCSYKMSANPAYRLIERARRQYHKIRGEAKRRGTVGTAAKMDIDVLKDVSITDSESSSSDDNSDYPRTGKVADMKAFQKLVPHLRTDTIKSRIQFKEEQRRDDDDRHAERPPPPPSSSHSIGKRNLLYNPPQ